MARVLKGKGPKGGSGSFGIANEFDERTTKEFEAQEFSGLRANDMWNRFEIWIRGRIANTLTYQEFFLRPERLNLMYCETFGIVEVKLEDHVQRAIQELEDRKRNADIMNRTNPKLLDEANKTVH